MPARVLPADLENYLDVVPGSMNLVPFIEDAHLLVEETIPAGTFSEARLKLIEKVLGAHLYTLAKEHGGLKSEQIQDARTQYASQEGLGLHSTRYGSLLLGLDTSGSFEALIGDRKKAELKVY